MGYPGRVWLRTERVDPLVHLGELDEAEGVLLERLIVLVELGHEKSELVVVRLDLFGLPGRTQSYDTGSKCFHHDKLKLL